MKKFKKGFTLAEIMIVLTIIGIISAIVMPNVGKLVSSENKNIARFKKGHNDLLQVMDTIVKSDKYYIPGDLSTRPDGTKITGNNADDVTYFCKSVADTLKTKKINCNSTKTTFQMEVDKSYPGLIGTSDSADVQKWRPDDLCKVYASTIGEEIVTADGIVYYQTSTITFGNDEYPSIVNPYTFLHTNKEHNDALAGGADDIAEGIDDSYRLLKVFCMDIDGIGKGELPFGYAIRADGRIFTGKKADEWLEKNIGKE